MRPGTLQDLLIELDARGLSVALSSSGEPMLNGPLARATPGVRSAVRWLAGQVLAHLRGEAPRPDLSLGPREWLWRDGHAHADSPTDEYLFGHADRHPAGALWWRPAGEAGWRRIAGRGDPAYELPREPEPTLEAEGEADVATHTRQCPFDRCGVRIPSERFACPAHWRRLSNAQKDAVWAAYSDWQKGKLTGDELRQRQREILDQAQGE